MVCFQDLFIAANGSSVEYNGKRVVLFDKFDVSNGERLVLSIESTNSKYTQGVSLDITGCCEVHGKEWRDKKGVDMLFWEDSELIDPKHIEITVFSKDGVVFVQNIWERQDHLGKNIVDRGHNGAAMIVEEIETGSVLAVSVLNSQ